jgi:2-methylisocitrate lyase-like PEP mutase family enzyme
MSIGRSVQQKREKFRELLRRKSLTVMPGGFSPLYARLAEEAGFESFFLAGSQLSAFLYGVPDNGIIGLRELVDHARHMVARTDIPIFIDADTGFGNAVNVHFTVQECIRSGVAALQIEDQEAPKKSGTAAGRRCIPLAEAVGKVQAAIAARNELDPDFAICARCDAIGAQGGSFEDALDRCIAYVRDGGADFVWLNSVETRDQLATVGGVVEQQARVLAAGFAVHLKHGFQPHSQVGDARIRIGHRARGAHRRATAAAHAQVRFDDAVGRGAGMPALPSPWGRPDTKALLGAGKIREIEECYLPDNQRRDYAATWGHKTSYADTESAPQPPPKPKP